MRAAQDSTHAQEIFQIHAPKLDERQSSNLKIRKVVVTIVIVAVALDGACCRRQVDLAFEMTTDVNDIVICSSTIRNVQNCLARRKRVCLAIASI